MFVSMCFCLCLFQCVSVYVVHEQADPHNAVLLRQYDTYYRWHDTYGKGENLQKCLLCRGGRLCEICYLKVRSGCGVLVCVGVCWYVFVCCCFTVSAFV
jgi:hypothetical protein